MAGGLKLRVVVPALPCEEGLNLGTLDPRMPAVLQALSDLGRNVLDLNKQLAIVTGNSVVASLPLTTKGDILGRSTTENKRFGIGTADQVLTVDLTQELDLKWKTIVFPGYARGQYGDGADGDLSLVGDTVLTASQYVFRYNNVALNGFILTCADDFTLLQVKGTLSLGGGKIQARQQAQVNGGASQETGGGGVGGKGGGAVGVLYLFAKTIVDSGGGRISADGVAGTAGTLGGTVSENTGIAGGTNGSGTAYLQGTAFAGGNSTGGGVPGAGVASTAFTALQKTTFRNCLAWLQASGIYLDTTSQWYSLARSGAGGAAGEGQTVGGAGGGGGGGGGNAGNGGNGGAGGARGSGPGPAGGGGGGGGGGGAAGGFLIVVTDSVTTGVTFSANGGNGGGGALGGPATFAGAGGTGGGGGGGLVIVVSPGGGTLSATGGTSSGGGVAGGVGVTMNLSLT